MVPAETNFPKHIALSPALHDTAFAILDCLGSQCALQIVRAGRSAAAAQTQIQRYISIKNSYHLRSETYLSLPPRL